MSAMILACARMRSVRECNRKSCDIHCILAHELHVLCNVRILSPRALFTPPAQHECTIGTWSCSSITVAMLKDTIYKFLSTSFLPI